MVGKSDVELPESYNHIPLIMFGPGIKPMKYDGLGMQVDVMPTLLGLMGVSYNYDGFGVDCSRCTAMWCSIRPTTRLWRVIIVIVISMSQPPSRASATQPHLTGR